jgi:hypothetical protein
MTQTCTDTTSSTSAKSGLARLSGAITDVVWLAGRDGWPTEAPLCPANPVSGHARPIMGQQLNTAAAAPVNASLTGMVNSSFHTTPASKAAPGTSRGVAELQSSGSLSGSWPLPKNASWTEPTTLRIRANRANLADEGIS